MGDKIVPEKAMNFKPGDLLFSEGGPGDFFYIIQEGKVEVFKTKNGEKIPLALVTKGQCLGEFSVIDGRPRSASASAVTDVIALKISGRVMSTQMKKIPPWFKTIVMSLVTRTRRVNEILKRNQISDQLILDQIEQAEFHAEKAGEANEEPSAESSIATAKRAASE